MATQREIAEHLCITQQQVSRLVREGIIQEAPKGQYDLDEARKCVLLYLRGAADRATGDVVLPLGEKGARVRQR